MKLACVLASVCACALAAALVPSIAFANEQSTIDSMSPAQLSLTVQEGDDTNSATETGDFGNDADSQNPSPIDIAKAKVKLAEKKLPYTGRAIKPQPTVTLGNTILEAGNDYRISYKANKAVGTATITITGVGAYTGMATAHFTITPKAARLASAKSTDAGIATVKVRKAAGATAYQFRVATNKAFTKNVKTARVSERSFTFKNLLKGKRYYVQARAYKTVDGKRIWGDWSATKTVKVLKDGKWKKSEGYFYYYLPTKKLAKGLTEINGKTYLFDKKGRQLTGWQWYKDSYLFFNPANKQDGYMQTKCVINGIKLRKDGTAISSGNAGAELYVMWKAQKVLESLTTPAQSKRAKLLAGFNWMRDECNESNPRAFSAYSGWHRTFALDILDDWTGSCYSCGAAFAYYANAVGCESCAVISSGGHGWAEVDGNVYDVEWSRHSSHNYFDFPYSWSGWDGTPNYAANRTYVVWIAPQTSRW